MPYAPGVVDRSGEHIGAGYIGLANTFSQGMNALKQRKDENKQLESENKALELVAKSTAGKVGLPPEMVEQLTLSSPDETPKARNARLKTTLAGVLQQSELDAHKQ